LIADGSQRFRGAFLEHRLHENAHVATRPSLGSVRC